MAAAEPPAPPGYADCDKPGVKNPVLCRKLVEGIHCLRNPSDPWCRRQREKREARNRALAIAGLLLLALAVVGRR